MHCCSDNCMWLHLVADIKQSNKTDLLYDHSDSTYCPPVTSSITPYSGPCQFWSLIHSVGTYRYRDLTGTGTVFELIWSGWDHHQEHPHFTQAHSTNLWQLACQFLTWWFRGNFVAVLVTNESVWHLQVPLQPFLLLVEGKGCPWCKGDAANLPHDVVLWAT